MSATFFTIKDPDATLDYIIDWTPWLIGTDTINNSTWIVPTGLSTTNNTYGTASTTVWLTGGTIGEVYDVTNRVTSALGRIDERSIEFTLVDR